MSSSHHAHCDRGIAIFKIMLAYHVVAEHDRSLCVGSFIILYISKVCILTKAWNTELQILIDFHAPSL